MVLLGPTRALYSCEPRFARGAGSVINTRLKLRVWRRKIGNKGLQHSDELKQHTFRMPPLGWGPLKSRWAWGLGKWATLLAIRCFDQNHPWPGSPHHAMSYVCQCGIACVQQSRLHEPRGTARHGSAAPIPTLITQVDKGLRRLSLPPWKGNRQGMQGSPHVEPGFLQEHKARRKT